MKEIKVIRQKKDLINIDNLISIILLQMTSIGSKKDYEQIKYAVENALSNSNRSVFFLYLQDNIIKAFAFGNICAGLESGADYLWINELFVSEEIRHNNIASQILSFI